MRLASFVPSAAKLSHPHRAPVHEDRVPTPEHDFERSQLAKLEDASRRLTIEDFVRLARMSGAL